MKTIYQIITKNDNMKYLDYNFIKLKKDEKMFFKNKKHELEIRYRNLHDIINVFDLLNIQYWLQGKTMLGIVKDKKLLENDNDEDIGTMISNLEDVCNKIIPLLLEKKFKIIRATKNNSMVSLMRDYRYVDICFFNYRKNKIIYENKYFPKEYYDSFEKIKVSDFEYSIPCKYNKIINYSYNIKI